jgi:hypothetical protein
VDRGPTGAAVDLGATLDGSSDCKLSKMRVYSVRPLTALGPGALGKAAHRHFPKPQKFEMGVSKGVPNFFFPNFKLRPPTFREAENCRDKKTGMFFFFPS